MKSFASLVLFAGYVAAQTPGSGSSTGFCDITSAVAGDKINVELSCNNVVRATRAYFGRCLLLPYSGIHVWGSQSVTTNAAALCVTGTSCAADGPAPALFIAAGVDAEMKTEQAVAGTPYTWAKKWAWSVDQATIRNCADTKFNSGPSTDSKSFTSTEGNSNGNIWAQTWISLANDATLSYQPLNLDSKFLIRLGTFTGFWSTDFTAAVDTTVAVTYQNTDSKAASLQAKLTLHYGASPTFDTWVPGFGLEPPVKNGDLLGYTVSIANSPIDSDLVVAIDQVKFLGAGGAVVDQLLLGQGVYDNTKPLIQARGVVVVAFPFAVSNSTWTFQVTGTLTPPGCASQGVGPSFAAADNFLYDVVGGLRSQGAATPACTGRRFLLQANGDSFAGSGQVTVDAPLVPGSVSSASSATLSAAILLVAAALL